jgi:hypothetical protein
LRITNASPQPRQTRIRLAIDLARFVASASRLPRIIPHSRLQHRVCRLEDADGEPQITQSKR